ncbi:MAG: FAD-dependent monooxygenase, partial [Verrucomicrobiae bacterium]|nr:FAD-dependent monooxygenase [Verrucomicrobiae bacterium]
LANYDGSYSGNIFLKRGEGLQFRDFQIPEILEKFMRRQLFDLEPYWNEIESNILSNKEAFIVCNRLSQWSDEDKVLLVGDSSHAFYHFYAQGLNMGMEDSLYLKQLLADRSIPDFSKKLQTFQKVRKPNADIMMDLSERNFFFLKDKTLKVWINAMDRSNHFLNRITPRWKLEYELITDGDCLITEAMERIHLQRKIFWVTCFWLFGFYYMYLSIVFGLRKLRAKIKRKKPESLHPVFKPVSHE